MFPWHQYLLGLTLICTGFLHFKLSKKCESIVPSFIPVHSSMVLLFGIIEMILGLMLITSESQIIAAWGIIILMIIYLIIPLYWLFKQNEKSSYPKWFWLICILFQIGTGTWAYTYI
jgi:uncharacterized membrane protein